MAGGIEWWISLQHIVIENDSKDNPISNNYFTPAYTSFSSYKFNLITF